MYNHAAWFNKHGHKGEPAGVPQCVNNTLKGYAVELERKRGYIPDKSKANIKGKNWLKLGRALGIFGTAIVFAVGAANNQSPAEIATDMVCNTLWGCGGE